MVHGEQRTSGLHITSKQHVVYMRCRDLPISSRGGRTNTPGTKLTVTIADFSFYNAGSFIGNIFDGTPHQQVPRLWAFTITGDEFSWILPTLGLWFSSLITRDEQDRAWLNNGRPTCYWLTGFFNPQVRKRKRGHAMSIHLRTKYIMRQGPLLPVATAIQYSHWYRDSPDKLYSMVDSNPRQAVPLAKGQQITELR